MAGAAGIAALKFVPWKISEVAVYQTEHSLVNNIAWNRAPTEYDWRSMWADFLGLPPVHGGTALTLTLGVLLAGLAVYRSFSGRSALSARVTSVLIATALLPALLLFATSFGALSLTVFGERRLLPSIFSSVVLVAFGLEELSPVLPKPGLVWVAGAVCLGALQLSATVKLLKGPSREPYSEIAGDLKQYALSREAINTTWPWHRCNGEFYSGTDRVRPLLVLGDSPVCLLQEFLDERADDLKAFLRKSAGASMEQCRYYSAVASDFGTLLCSVEVGA